MPRYRHKGELVEARQARRTMQLPSPFGLVTAHPGDWILESRWGITFVVPDSRFRKEYEKIEDEGKQ